LEVGEGDKKRERKGTVDPLKNTKEEKPTVHPGGLMNYLKKW